MSNARKNCSQDCSCYAQCIRMQASLINFQSLVFQNSLDNLMEVFASPKCLLRRREDSKNLVQMRLGRLAKDFDNFPEHWVQCGKSCRSQLALIRIAASNGFFNALPRPQTCKANATAQTEQIQEGSCG